MAGWMIEESDPARLEIVTRAKALGITGNPDKAAHPLGKITLANGTTVNAHVVHAADAIIEDGTRIVMIARRHEPGRGKPCLPGGFLDPLPNGGVEDAPLAAAREAFEETGATGLGIGELIGTRNMDRPYDVRVAKHPLPLYGIAEGDIFMVSTQAVRFHVPDVNAVPLTEGDDAESVHRVEIASLSREKVGIANHFDLIEEALRPTLQERQWMKTLGPRTGATLTPP